MSCPVKCWLFCNRAVHALKTPTFHPLNPPSLTLERITINQPKEMIFGTSENFTVSPTYGLCCQKPLKGGIDKRIAQTEWSHKFVEPTIFCVSKTLKMRYYKGLFKVCPLTLLLFGKFYLEFFYESVTFKTINGATRFRLSVMVHKLQNMFHT